MAKRRIRWGRVLAAMIGLSCSIFIADGIKRDMHRSNTSNIKVEGDFVGDQISDKKNDKQSDEMLQLGLINTKMPSTTTEGVQNLGFSELSIPDSKLSTGMLAIINNEHPAGTSSDQKRVNLLKYKNEFYSLVSENVKLNEEAAEALNNMMAAYNEATGLSDFIVYGTNDTYTGDGSSCPEYFPESAAGNTIDLALNAGGSIIAFDGYDTEGWIIDNCEKYGFIVRYPKGKEAKTKHDFCPWHLRYVGGVHAAIMDEKDMCLEEYIDFLKGFSFDKSFSYAYNGVNYEIYTSPAKNSAEPARVPVSGTYTVSGDNIGTFIITTVKN